MANSDKNIVITPNIGQTDDPKIVFSGADATTAAQNISLYAYPNDNGTLSFEGSAGQLFSITNSLSGTIFSVNDVSGIPSIEVDADGTIRLAEFSGDVGIGISTPSARLDVNGTIYAQAGATFDPPGVGTDTSTTAAFALDSGSAIVGVNNGYIRNMLSWTSGSDITIGAGGTNLIGGINFQPGNTGTVKINGQRIFAEDYHPNADTLTTARTIALSGAATGTATSFNGSANITIPVTALNASNLSAGTVPDARLSGTYTGFTHKIDGVNTVFTSPNSGSTATNARTVYGLAEYKSNSSAQPGAIVFIAPNTTSSIMHQLEVQGLLYNQNIFRMTVQGYRTTGGWADVRKISFGTVDIQTRWAVTPDGKNCLILGDVGSTWSYPHFSIVRAMFSHTGTVDSYCSGWTVAAVTDLTGYTQISSTITDSTLIGSVSGNAATATTLQTTRTLWGQNFNGSADVTGNLTSVGNITGSGAVTITAGGTNQNITLTPSGTGTVNAPTFNATSTSSGGFQGIDADTAAAPSFTWSGDLNTGIWRAGEGAIGFSADGTNYGTLNNDYFTHTSDIRSPIFYDSNNTGYYFDGASTTRLNAVWANGYYNGGISHSTGPILTYTLTSGGSGYTNGTYLNQVLSGGSGVYATFDFTVSGGVVTVATLTERGSGFFPTNTIAIPALGGTGSGGLITVDTVRTVDMSLYSTAARIRLGSNDTSLGASQEIGGIYFNARDASAGGAGDKAYILGTAEGASGGGKIEFWTSANGGSPTLCGAFGGANDFRLYNTAGTFYHAFSNAPTANRTLTLPDITGDVLVTSGTTNTAGYFNTGGTTPNGSTRLNYSGYFYPTFINLVGSGDTGNAATHYFVETASDGFVRPKTIANVRTEIVTAAAIAGAVAPSTSGNVLTSNGTSWISAAPSGGSEDPTKLPLAGGTMTGLLVGRACASTDVNTANDTGSFSIRSQTGGTTVAAISFHRPSAYAINMGLGTDNVFRIGGWSASANCLQLSGTGNLTILNDVSAVNFNSTSDETKKKNIETISSASEKVRKLRGVNFDWKDSGNKAMGVIAQEVEKIIPEVVITNDDGIKTVQYGNLVGLLIESFKEQDEKIDNMRNEIDELKNLVKQLMETR